MDHSSRPDSSSTLPKGPSHDDLALLPAEDDEIPLDSSSEGPGSSSDVSMSDSDGEAGCNPLISTGHEHIPNQPWLSGSAAAPVHATRQGQNMSRKRKSPEASATVVSAKKVKLDGKGTAHCPLDKFLLPAEIWHRIFTYTPPRTLGNLLCVNRLFNVYLDPSSRYQCNTPSSLSQTSTPLLKPDAIWQISRRRFWPRMPAPLQQKTELDMWRLGCGKRCQFCGRADLTSPNSPASKESNKTRCVWAFALRSCGPCLAEKTVKEIDLLLSSSMPSLLIPALPFLLITSDMRTVSFDTLQKGPVSPDLHVTKTYLSEHVENLKQEFLSVKSMGGATAEEWLKGLEVRGKELLGDSMRWEKWASAGGIIQMQTRWSLDNILNTTVSSDKAPVPADASRASKSHSNSSSGVEKTCQSTSSSTITSLFDNDSTNRISTSQHVVQSNAPRPRTREEALELKAVRRAEIERRAMELDPPLPANVLAHIPSFQAAIQIISPLDGNAWDLLKPRLLSQRADAEHREKHEQDVTTESHEAPEPIDEHHHSEGNNIATKQLIDKAWDDVQAPLRARISVYADELIRDSWSGGSKVNMENSPQFAAEILLCVRKRFYAEIVKDAAAARDAGQEPIQDPPDGPFTQKLTLENMKWLFDVKIKPHTEAYRKDLFFCNGCEVTLKAFGFEGVIQHYAAKHTNALSLGSVVVHWRAEWPDTSPFRPDPQAMKIADPSTVPSYETTQAQNKVASLHHNHSAYSSSSHLASFQPTPSFPIPPLSHGPSGYGPPTQHSAPYGQSSPFVSGQHDYSSSHPHHPPTHAAYSLHGVGYPGPQQPYTPGVHNGPPTYPPAPDAYFSHNYNAHQSNSRPSYQNPYGNSLAGKYHAQLEYLARNSRELWNCTAGLKELPGSIRVFVVIHHIVNRFRSRFSESPPLSMFIDGLSNNKEMRPVRNVNGLVCKACHLGIAGPPPDQDRRTFSLPQLVNHFQQRHVDQSQALGTPLLDWAVHMVHTPDLTVLSNLHHLANMDNQKVSLISEAFPSTQHPHGYPREVSATTHLNTWSDVGSTSYISQQPAYRAPTQQPPQYDPRHPMAGYNTDTPSLQDLTRATDSSQKLDLNQSSMRGTPPSGTRQKSQQGGSGLASPETWPELRKQKGNHNRDQRRNGSSQGFRNRKSGGGVAPTKVKPQEPNEEYLVAEEERRQEEEIRAMWAADRKETARLASRNQHLVEPEEFDASIAVLGTGHAGNHYQMIRDAGPPPYPNQTQDRQQPVIIREREDDDLMAGLESQLDQQQTSSEHFNHRSRYTNNASHEKHPPYGYMHPSQDRPRGELRSGSPVYPQHNSQPRLDSYRDPDPYLVGMAHEPTRTVTTQDDASHDRAARQEYYHAQADDPRARQPQYAEAYELVRVRDSQGEYFIRRPIRLEQEPPYAALEDGRDAYRDAGVRYRAYENDDYSSVGLGYESTSRIETPLRQRTYETGIRTEGMAKEPLYDPFSRDDPAAYEDYDPRFPAAPPVSNVARQARYR